MRQADESAQQDAGVLWKEYSGVLLFVNFIVNQLS
jgi:hypothetical protein